MSTATASVGRKSQDWQPWVAVATMAMSIVVYLAAHDSDREWSLFWVFGVGFGFVLQRSRFCFASAFRDVFLLGHGRTMRGLLAGLAVATLGFGLVMSRQVPTPFSGILPTQANVLPLGLHTILGGLMFGVGMVVSGGCVSGSIYRMGEGYVASWVSFIGIAVGLLFAGYTWNWWWDAHIAAAPRIWLPTYLGHPGAIGLTLVVLFLGYLALLWWENRQGIVVPEPPFEPTDDSSVRGQLSNLYRRVFRHGWPVVIGGVVLGGMNVMLYTVAHAWGFTGEVSRWAIGAANAFGFGPGDLAGAATLPGCALEVGDGGVLSHMLFLVIGMLVGSFIAALLSREFRIRVPRKGIRFVQAAGGGVVMGYGAGIAMGSTIGAFFSAVPALAVNGWVFAVFLAAGAWIGTKIIARL